jgi:hypothetical protein
VPYARVQQTAPRGVLVTPWGTRYSNADALTRLVVADNRSPAEGRFVRPVEFMKARSHRSGRAPQAEYVQGGDVVAARRPHHHRPDRRRPHRPDFAFAAGLAIGETRIGPAGEAGL